MFKKQKFILFTIAFLISLFAFSGFASAQENYGLEYSSILELGTRGLRQMVFTAINVILSFLGVLAITIILYGGFLWMSSGGNPEKIEKAKRVLISAVIGMALIIFSYAIAQFIMKSLTDITGGGGGMAGSPCDCVLEIGTCAPSTCLRCTETSPLPDQVCKWLSDMTCPGCTGTTNFTAQKFSPPVGHPDPTIRNAVVRVSFSQNVGGTVDDVSFIVHDNTSGLNVLGTRATIGNRIEFAPNTPCDPPHGAWNCFDANHNFTIKVKSLAGAGILRLSDGIELTCDAMNLCTASFNVGTIIDTQNPTNLNFNLAGNLCIESPNNLTASADDDSAIAIFDFSDDHIPAFSFTDNAPVCNGAIPNHCDGLAVWTPTAIGGYIANDNYTLTVKATDLDSNSISANKNVRLRAAHCCNNNPDLTPGDPVLDGGPPEEGIDCGGECAACVGSACDIDIGDPACNCDDNECASGICDCKDFAPSSVECEAALYPLGTTQCCLCQEGPIIDCITPNDTDSCDPHGKPIGTAGNLISIWGRNFGAYGPASQVTINGIQADLANTANPQCNNIWTNTQIIIVVPPGAVNGVIEVTADSGYSDATNDGRGPIIPNFNDDGKVRPGLCKVENIEAGSICLGFDCGFYEEEVRGHGLNINATTTIEFGNSSSNVAGLSPTPIPDLKIDCGVPNIQSGNVGFRAKSAGGDYGNYLNFRVTESPEAPRIDYIEPTEGPIGQYITIYGSRFGDNLGAVIFKNIDTGVDTNGSFIFPPQCDSLLWNDTYIIVKVPNVSSGDYKIRVITNGSEETNEVDFEVCDQNTTTCPLNPGICGIDPDNGPVGTIVEIHGEYFKARDMAISSIKFFNEIDAAISSWSNEQVKTTVPVDATTGSIVLTDKDNRDSNGVPFKVGKCEDDTDCSGGKICCPDGVCRIQCEPNFCKYEWSFTTGDYFIREECDTTKQCREGTGPCDPIVPSPTPWIAREGGGHVCINAAIGASFSKNVFVTEASINASNVLVQKCSDSTCDTLETPLIGIFTYIPPATGEIIAFEFHPDSLLEKNTWYQVKLNGGLGGLTTMMGISLIDDYIWHFKTRNNEERCEVGKVVVNPNPAKLVMFDATQNFTATLTSKDNPCIILNANPRVASTTWFSDNTAIATVIDQNAPTTTAKAVGNGKVYIKATAMPDNKTGKALLEVDFQGLSIIDHWYECDSVCINAEMGLRFDTEVNSASLTTGAGNNINIYNCGVDSKCYVDLTSIPIVLTNPAYFWNNTTGDSFTTFSAVGNFNQDKYYRAIIKTGDTGIESILGDHLITLNSNLAFGEECDGEALCDAVSCVWDDTEIHCGQPSQECYPDDSKGCSNKCLNTGSVANTCGDATTTLNNIYENCDDGDTDSGDGCSSKCLYEGSTGTAKCGNSIIEFGEACDDGNQTLGDGCDNKCLREGADFGQEKTTASGLVYKCGSDGLQQDANGAGEDCDDGNLINGDGCSNKCLSEGVKSSVCGDGKIGIGEDCDDGNTDIKDGCSNFCLNEGSMGLAECGNREVEKNENDAYSWVFKTKAEPDAYCKLSSVEVIPNNASAFIGDILNYRSVGRSSSIDCDPRGQLINPWDYDWTWWSDDITVADMVGIYREDFNIDMGGWATSTDPCVPPEYQYSVEEGVLKFKLVNIITDCGFGIKYNFNFEKNKSYKVRIRAKSNNNIGENYFFGLKKSGVIVASKVSEITENENFEKHIFEFNNLSDDCDEMYMSVFGTQVDGDYHHIDYIVIKEIDRVGAKDPFQQVVAIGPIDAYIHASTTNAVGNIIKGKGKITVKEPTGPGVPCISGSNNCCQSGVSSCMDGYSCMDNGLNDCDDPSFAINECFCCCDMTHDDCPAPLECFADVDPCIGNDRGWCCGCENDADCLVPLLCGNDTCCRPRPEVVPPTMPANGDTAVCRNVLISADFNQEMKKSSLRNNFKLYKTMGVLTNTDFEDGAVGSVPTDWSKWSQKYSEVGISINESNSPGQSVLLHQYPDIVYPGTCTQAICVDIGVNCTWLIGTSQCSFTRPDAYGTSVYNEGQNLYWPNVAPSGALKLVYNVAPLNWQVGEQYILKFYYKGHTDSKINVELTYTMLWYNQCSNSLYVFDQHGNCLSSYGSRCVDRPTHCCKQHSMQTDCYTKLQFPSIPAGTTESDWTVYSTNFTYTQKMAELLDKDGGLHNEIGLWITRVATGAEGTDFYIDDFQVISIDSIEVKGKVDSYELAGGTVATFAPDEVLDPSTYYFARIFGDPNISDTVAEGVLSEYGIAMDGDYEWNFTTGEIICDIDYIKVDVEVGDAPYPNNITYDDMSSDIFLCAGKDDCARDADGVAAGNQHLFYASAIDYKTGNTLNSDDFDWIWTETDSQDIFSFLNPATTTADLTANPVNGKAYLNIEAISKVGSIDYGNKDKKMTINSFMCENPWPDIKYWPWEDWILDGGISKNPTADCDITTGICKETYFDMFYCRDDGEDGATGDLPMISMDPIVRSEDDEILKEMFFIIGDDFGGSYSGPSITNESVSPCSGADGTLFTVTADVYDIDGVDNTTVKASIQLPDETEIISIDLLDDGINPDITPGDGTYAGNWTSAGCAGECAYFVDVKACDLTAEPDCSEEENILCL